MLASMRITMDPMMVNPRTWTTCWATLLVVKDRPGDYQLLTWWFGGNAIFLCRDCVTQQCNTLICFLVIHTRFLKLWLRCWNSLRTQRSRGSGIRERTWKLLFSLPSAYYSVLVGFYWFDVVFSFDTKLFFCFCTFLDPHVEEKVFQNS